MRTVRVLAVTGMGISAAFMTRILDSFFSTKRAGKGRGVGLLVSFGIIGNRACVGTRFYRAIAALSSVMHESPSAAPDFDLLDRLARAFVR